MSQFVDRRQYGKNKSAANRQRFLRRFKLQIKSAVSNAIAKRSITNMDAGEKVVIPSRDLSEPIFQHGKGGVHEIVHPGNKDFLTGDRIQRPKADSGQGNGSEASNQGEGEDNFTFELSREEFLDLYFEDLELPDLIRKQIANIPEHRFIRAGYTTDGVPTNINVVRTMRQAYARRIAQHGPFKKTLQEKEEQLSDLLKMTTKFDERVIELQKVIRDLKKRHDSTPFLDTIDLRYNNRIHQPRPTTQAVMFCLMDVSGSMDEVKKEIAKRFFILLYLFLKRNYEKVEIVFIRHHTSAKEVEEEEFFYSRETGGTVVSSALEMMKDIMQQRYPLSSWNIYAAQASDGDNWNADSPYCLELLSKYILPYVQYFAYVEIMPRHHQSLWEAYSTVKQMHEHFAMQNIDNLNDIYPVFRDLFKRQRV